MEWSKASETDLKDIKGICLDIDDTLSSHGKLTAQAYQALWSLKDAGYAIVPITGRPAGWCDHIVRFWPVDAVVGENGAFTFYMGQGVRRRLETPCSVTYDESRRQLKGLENRIKAQFPHAKWASDQSYREFDLAIDTCEDVPPWKAADVDALLRLCQEAGAHAKLSSIHVNAWFGDYDKRTGFSHWLTQGAPGLGKTAPAWNQWMFIGDSPNDEPLFASFACSVGVANLKPYLSRLKNHPKWITNEESGSGFAEMARKMVKICEK